MNLSNNSQDKRKHNEKLLSVLSETFACLARNKITGDKKMSTEVVTGLAPETVTDWSVYTIDSIQRFKETEFRCKCGKCTEADVSLEFADKLFEARKISHPVVFNFTSGCRCPEHNRSEGGRPTSDHLTPLCEGADIITRTDSDRYAIIGACMAVGLRIKIYRNKNIVHVGLGKRNVAKLFMIG